MLQSEPPTNVANLNDNPADMITIAVILKHPGPDGTSLFDYAYGPNGKMFSFFWPCAGLQTSDGKVAFRMVIKQRVFEASFYVNGQDVLDGSERVLYLPNAFTDLNEVAHE